MTETTTVLCLDFEVTRLFEHKKESKHVKKLRTVNCCSLKLNSSRAGSLPTQHQGKHSRTYTHRADAAWCTCLRVCRCVWCCNKWYGHVSLSSSLAKTTLQVKGERRRGRQIKRWEDSIREWTSLELAKSQKAVKTRGKKMEETSCEIIRGAPKTLAVKG